MGSFANAVGEDSIGFIDNVYNGSSNIDETTENWNKTSLFISREIGAREAQCFPSLVARRRRSTRRRRRRRRVRRRRTRRRSKKKKNSQKERRSKKYVQ